MNEIRYAVFDGYVNSTSDYDRHFITAGQLMRLYGIDPKNALVFDGERERGLSREFVEGLIHLHPRYDGNYSLPESEGAQ